MCSRVMNIHQMTPQGLEPATSQLQPNNFQSELPGQPTVNDFFTEINNIVVLRMTTTNTLTIGTLFSYLFTL